MAEANPSSDGNHRKLRNSIEILENNAEHLKQEINAKLDSLIESINSQRKKLLDQVNRELHEAIEPLKNFENKNAARMDAKERLAKELEGDLALLSRLTSEIDEELCKMEVDLPNFRIQWNPLFFGSSEDPEEVGELKVDKHSHFDGSSKTPLWSTLNRGKADNEVGEPKAIAIDTETSNIYVGDASAGKILIMDKTGKYLNTLTFRKPSSIRDMTICQNYIYCQSNNFMCVTLYRLDKNTGKLLRKYNNGVIINAFIAVPDQVFVCRGSNLTLLLPDFTKQNDVNLNSPYLRSATSHVGSIRCANEELIMLITSSNGYPLQVFDKCGTFLRAIEGDIPVLTTGYTDVYMCIDERWNIIITIDGNKLLSV